MKENHLPYELSREANSDLEDIFDLTCDKFGLDQAITYLSNIENTFIQLSLYPLSGKDRSEIKEELRSIINRSHTIFYSIKKNNIRIVRVLHTSRDVIKFLPPEDIKSQ